MESIKLSIPTPCHENWHKMTPTEKGRFCQMCSKEVIDFSSMSDTEVLNFFTDKMSANVCGRVLPQQLERNIKHPVTLTQKIAWYWKYVVASVFLFAKLPTKAQKVNGGISITPTVQQNCNVKVGELRVVPQSKKGPDRIYKGKIVDADSTPIAGASIKSTHSNALATSDVNGNFTITIPKDSIKMVEVSGEGYELKKFMLSPINNVIVLDEKVRPLMGMVAAVSIIKQPEPSSQLKIVDSNTKNPIENASVIFYPQSSPQSSDTAHTDKEGVFKFGEMGLTYKPVNYTFKVVADGYESQEFNINLIELPGYSKEIQLVSHKNLVRSKQNNKIDIIKATPNPISKGSSFTINLQLAEKGNYVVQIINTQGNVILNKNIQAFSKNFAVAVMTTGNWSSGMYFIKLISDKGEQLATNRFVVQ